MNNEQENNGGVTGQSRNIMDPCLRATRAWVAEVEKLQQTTLENMSRAVDEGYKLAREGLGNLATFQTNFRKQWQAQMDRAREVLSSLIP
jgi:hypothetical protein